ncbi:ABC transporter permease [Paenibacillus albus]|uniref:Sugar ABC transporter permease n=1 Tax=Paenibacillus albus TaxID=2495582 RepID=A0A3Q8X7X4_9BACL|nr:ABC transporter permease subunit [Paenibacillus albus]AZN42386.1 sugar ABC transporter permease [Paenibacillus albus]
MERSKAAAARRTPRPIRKLNKDKYLLLMVLPCLIYYLVFRYAPMFGLVISFKNYNLFKGVWASPWVGFKYYHTFLNSPDFVDLLRNTILLGVTKLVFSFPAPILLALMLNEVTVSFLKRFVQTVSYLPHFISNVVVASMVLTFLSPSTGIVNHWLKGLGFHAVNFMSEPGWFRPVYVLSEIWQHVGWETIIYLAALTAIDPLLYEAARIDGANRWRQTLSVTLPGIAPTIIILFIFNIGDVLDIGFEKVFLLASPAIYSTADIISTYVYRVGLGQGNYSYAASIDLFTSIISLIFVCTANYLARKFSDNSIW